MFEHLCQNFFNTHSIIIECVNDYKRSEYDFWEILFLTNVKSRPYRCCKIDFTNYLYIKKSEFKP
jgi:hypothetical protein